MKNWSAPAIPALSSVGTAPRVYSSSAQSLVDATQPGRPARLYVCGITPYDATHLGHAATYIAFDLLNRAWRDAGLEVIYVQNSTDVDDPLLERANQRGLDWRELADDQIELFRTDMEALRVIPPASFIGAVETIPQIAVAVEELIANGSAYVLDNGDVYYRVSTAVTPPFGYESRYDRATMEKLSAERGGDPDTPGKEDPIDPLLWRSARPGEPHWPGGSLGEGRPGWHVECTVIARDYAGLPLTVQAGGSDLIFPHHEMGAAHASALTGTPLAEAFAHAGMVGYEGEKMSKSRGNLVLVSTLRASGVDPMAIRLAILAHHYRSDWMYDDSVLATAVSRVETWRRAASAATTMPSAHVIASVRDALVDDLNAPTALEAVDEWASTAQPDTAADSNTTQVVQALDALLGVAL